MKTDKQFGEALKEIMDRNNLTYEKLAKLSGVSKTYLTQIIVHAKIPSKEIIEKISKSISVEPLYFREYRIIRIIEKIELYHWVITSKDINEIEKILERIDKREIKSTKAIGKLKGNKEVEYSPSVVLDITDFNESQRRIMKNLYNDLKVTREDQKREEKIMQSFLSDFINTEEFEGIIEANSHLGDWEDRYAVAYQQYKEKYYKDKK